MIVCPCCGKPKRIDGLGTALKPAMELIAIARKPLAGKTVAQNVLEHGTGAINVDGCRVGTDDGLNGGAYAKNGTIRDDGWGMQRGGAGKYLQHQGRWPANVIHDNSIEVIECFPPSDRPSARFYYSPKASAEEREEGLDDIERRRAGSINAAHDGSMNRVPSMRANHHPTVKPVDLMAWLVRMVTPPKGICLDPFMGSGSTGIAALRQGFRFVGIEQNEEYFEIACERIRAAYQKPDLFAERRDDEPIQVALPL